MWRTPINMCPCATRQWTQSRKHWTCTQSQLCWIDRVDDGSRATPIRMLTIDQAAVAVDSALSHLFPMQLTISYYQSLNYSLMLHTSSIGICRSSWDTWTRNSSWTAKWLGEVHRLRYSYLPWNQCQLALSRLILSCMFCPISAPFEALSSGSHIYQRKDEIVRQKHLHISNFFSDRRCTVNLSWIVYVSHHHRPPPKTRMRSPL